MTLDFYQHLPLQLNPIAFALGSFSVRWYSVSYLTGFASVYLVLLWRIEHGEFFKDAQISNFQFLISKQIQDSKKKITNKIRNTIYEIRNTLLDFLLITFLAGLLGGRLGYVLFYDFPFFLHSPRAIFWPFDQAGNFTGFYGMSYHGALAGAALASWIFLRRKQINFWRWADFVIAALPLGYFFGRIGNFLNGELYGRVTGFAGGMYFAADPMTLRHPSQLYDALLAGLVLFAALWQLRRRRLAPGCLFAIYLIGYGIARFVVEFFRQPDSQLGLVIWQLSMGQILSACLIIVGLFIWLEQNRRGGIIK